MPSTVNRQASIDSRRIALEREVTIRVPRFDSFVTEYSANISTTGMFIMSEKPQPPGTSFSFEFSVADDWKLIRGKAQVVWTRYRDEGPERPPGMGVRFLELDAQSRRLIRWIVEKHIREGGKPFELDELRSVIDQALEQVLEAENSVNAAPAGAASWGSPVGQGKAPVAATTGAAVSRRSSNPSDRHLLPLILTAAAVLAFVGALFWLTEWLPESQEQRAERTASAGVGDGAARAETGAANETARGDETSVTPTAQSEEAARGQEDVEPGTAVDAAPPPIGSGYRSASEAIRDWAQAWSDQAVDRYLGHYSRTFEPPGGLSRSQWSAQRRERLRAPGFIRVAVSGLETDRLDDSHVSAVFSQSYRSDRFSDMVRKRLDLVWEDGRWKIQRELTEDS